MILLSAIKRKLVDISEEKLLEKMGYNNLRRGQKTLQEFLIIDDIYLWLKAGYFDMKYDSESFLESLLTTLEIYDLSSKDEIQKYKVHLNSIKEMNQPYIFIDTNFNERSLYFSWGFMVPRTITIDKELIIYKSKDDIFGIIGETIKDHYCLSDGRIGLWGIIDHYDFHCADGSISTFDTNGKFIKDMRCYKK